MIRRILYRGAAALTLQHVIVALFSLLLMRQLGPGLFGAMTVAVFWGEVVRLISELGIPDYFARANFELTDKKIRTAFTTLLLLGTLSCSLAASFGTTLLVAVLGWTELSILMPAVALRVLLSLPSRLSIALLDRELRYGRSALIDFFTSSGFYLSALLLFHAGWGLRAIAMAEIIRGLIHLAVTAIRPYPMGLSMDLKTFLDLFSFGSNITGSWLILKIRDAVNPVIVAGLAGKEATGLVGFAQGLCGRIALLRGVSDRMSMSTLAWADAGGKAVGQVVGTGRVGQILFGIYPLFAFGSVGAFLIPLLLGTQWTPGVPLVLLYAVAIGIDTLFALYSNAFASAGMTRMHLRISAVLSIATTLLAVPCVYAWDAFGAPWAQILSTPAYLLVHVWFRRAFGPSRLSESLLLLSLGTGGMVLASLMNRTVFSALLFALCVGVAFLVSPTARGFLLLKR